MNKLNIGDKVYTFKYGAFTEYTIDRVTDKIAYSKSAKFDRIAADDEHFKIKAASDWGPFYATLENEAVRLWKLRLEAKGLARGLIKSLESVFLNSLDRMSQDGVRAKIEVLKSATALFSQ